MSIRTYLIVSYLALVLFITLGMLAGVDLVNQRLKERNITYAKEGVERLTRANMELSEKILSTYGEFMVEDLAQDVARELSLQIGNRKTYDYRKIRENPQLRRLATLEVRTPDGVAGYVDLLDNKGEAVLHPNPQVEGKNFSQWREQFPEMWELVQRSFTTPKVKGYYTFIDRNNRTRKKFMALAQVSQTPFIVASVVNIDDFFVPMQEKIQQAGHEVVAQATQGIGAYQDSVAGKVKLTALAGAGGFCLLGGMTGLVFAVIISRPLRRLKRGVEQVGEGNFEVAVPETGFKEVLGLAHSFNDLGRQLTDYIAKRDFIRDTFGRYVTKEVVQKLLESEAGLELGGETREVSILMSDLRGFTALTSGMEPEQVITFLNRYLGKMIEILLEHRAIIDEIIGDGILAFFGAPDPLEDHPVRGVACALAMQAAMEELNARNLSDGLPHLEMGIAVNTGSVVVGNIGSELRTKYSVIGSPVNVTGRMESFSVGGQVLIGQSTYSRVQNLVEVGEILSVQMKGVPGMSTLYDVRAIKAPYNIRLKERREILVPLAAPLSVRVYRICEKIVVGVIEEALIQQLSETRAVIACEGELLEWEDVRLQPLDENRAELPGKIYGKVISVQPGEGRRQQANVRFTSVSPEIEQRIHQALQEA